MKVTFLGTAGGRVLIMTQLRASGGLVLEMDGEMIHIDPGPGALVRAKQFGVDLRKLTAVIISHAHPDHYTDTEIIIESMTDGTRKKRGVLLGNGHAINGGDDYRQVVSPFHLRLLERYKVLKPGDKIKVGDIEITATPAKHREDQALGFVFRGSKSVGYAGDGEYYPGMEKHFEGCDCLILNVLRPRSANWPGHMNTAQAKELISKVKPKLAIIQHFGMLMIKANPEKEAQWIEEQTGVKTIAAKDGMKLDMNNTPRYGLEKWAGEVD